MIAVILLYPDALRKEVVLAGIPDKGDTIRLKDDSVSLVVEHRLWMEQSNGAVPSVLIAVRKSEIGERGGMS